jgi:hypothetical protein
VPAQPGRQGNVAVGRVVDLHVLLRAVDGDVEFEFADVDAGADHAKLGHLRHPFLVMRTLGSFNHPGLMKSRSRSCSGPAHKAEALTIRRPAPVPDGHPERGIPTKERTDDSRSG